MSNGQQGNSGGSNTSPNPNTAQQVQLAADLNNALLEVENTTSRINNIMQNQSDFAVQINESFSNMQMSMMQSMQAFTSFTNQIALNVESISQTVQTNMVQQFHDSVQNTNSLAMQGLTQQAQTSNQIGDALYENASEIIYSQQGVAEGLNDAVDAIDDYSDASQDYSEELQNQNTVLEDLSESMKSVSNEMENLRGGLLGTLKSLTSFATASVGILAKSFMGLLKNMMKFVKFSMTLPFTIANAVIEFGNKLRTDVVEVIGMAAEELKEKFDLHSNIGKGIQSLTTRGVAMMKAFRSPTSYLVKMFGYGAEGIANMIKYLGEQLDSMGHYAEYFGHSLGTNQKSFEVYQAYVKSLGLEAEGVKYIAMDSVLNLKHVNETLGNISNIVGKVSTSYSIDRKRLSKNLMVLRKDITLFGHLTNEELTETAAKMTQMKINMEDASAVFKKFDTFESAANSVAILSQAFGMNLDAMDLIKAKNPQEIFEIFRDSMEMTGKSFQQLDRFEKDLMVQHTGMTAESLNALMHYDKLGYTYKEAVEKMEAEKPDAKQLKALKELNSAIKQVQKVMTFTSPFEAFFSGISANATLTGSLKNSVMALSGGYEKIYDFARTLNYSDWYSIARPIKIIIDIMHDILQSDELKTGLESGIRVISDLVTAAFGATKSTVAINELDALIQKHSRKGGVLKTHSSQFNRAIQNLSDGLAKKDKEELDSAISAFGAKAIFLKNATSMKDLLEKLKLAKVAAEDDPSGDLEKALKVITATIKARINSIEIGTDKGPKIKFKTDSERLAGAVLEIGQTNKNNVGALAQLSLRTTGAILKGAMIGLTAILKLVNRGIDVAKVETDKAGKSNLLASFLNVPEKEFNKLGNDLGDAIKEFISKSEGIYSITKWMLTGFTDIFAIVIDLAVSTLRKTLGYYFGEFLGKGPTPIDALTKVKALGSVKPENVDSNMTTAIKTAEIEKAATSKGGKGGEVSSLSAAKMLRGLRGQISTLKSDSEEFTTLDRFEKFMREIFYEYDPKTMSEGFLETIKSLSSLIKDKKFVGGQDVLEQLENRVNLYLNDRIKASDSARDKQAIRTETGNRIFSMSEDDFIKWVNSVLKNEYDNDSHIRENYKNFGSVVGLIKESQSKNPKTSVASPALTTAGSNSVLTQAAPVQDAMFGDLAKGLTNMPKVLQNSLFGVNKLKFNLPEVDVFEKMKVGANNILNAAKTFYDSNMFVVEEASIDKQINLVNSIVDKMQVSTAEVNSSLESDSEVLLPDNGYMTSVESVKSRVKQKMTKRKVSEMTAAIQKSTKEMKNLVNEIDLSFIFDEEYLQLFTHKLMPKFAQNNYARIQSMPQNNQGVMFNYPNGSSVMHVDCDSSSPTSKIAVPGPKSQVRFVDGTPQTLV